MMSFPTAGTRNFEVCRVILTFFVCQSVGSLFYFVCALKYGTYPRAMGTILSVIMQFINCAMILFTSVRIIIFIAIPSLVTSRLRALLLVIILTWSVQNVALNVTSNIKTTAEGIICVQERVKYLATELKEGTDKNFRQVPIEKIQRFLQKSMQPFVKIRSILRNLDDSLGRMLSWQRAIIMKMKKALENCSIHAQAPYHACMGALTYVHSQCLENTYEVFCSPIILLKNLCYVSKILELHCEWPKMLKNQMEEGVDYFVKESKQKAFEYAQKTVFYDIYTTGKDAKKSFDTLEVRVNHSLNIDKKVDYRLDEFKVEFHKEVGYIETFFNIFTYFSDFVFAIILILPIIFAKRYIKKYQQKLSTDNYFITKELIELNNRQKTAKLATIFPLDKDESKKLIYWTNKRIVKQEYLQLTFSIALVFLSMGVPLVLVISDIFTYKVLNRGYEFFHSNLTRLKKPNVYHLKVSGEGFMAELLSNILNTFEPLNADSEQRDSMWHECFSEPTPPNYSLFRLMLLFFVLSLVLCFIQIYAKRIRHKIAAYYFPDRVVPRVVFLHNKTLEERFAREHPGVEFFLHRKKKTEDKPLVPARLTPSSSSSSF